MSDYHSEGQGVRERLRVRLEYVNEERLTIRRSGELGSAQESFLNHYESLEEAELSARDLITAEVLDNLEAVLEQFREIAVDLQGKNDKE